MKSSHASSSTDSNSAGSLLKVEMVAQRLNNSISTIYALIESGELEHYRCPGIRVSEDQLGRYLDSSRRGRREARPTPSPRPPKLNHIRLP
jgi:excisionase family DNA binding protein